MKKIIMALLVLSLTGCVTDNVTKQATTAAFDCLNEKTGDKDVITMQSIDKIFVASKGISVREVYKSAGDNAVTYIYQDRTAITLTEHDFVPSREVAGKTTIAGFLLADGSSRMKCTRVFN